MAVDGKEDIVTEKFDRPLMRLNTMGTRIISANRKYTLLNTMAVMIAFFAAASSVVAVIYSRPLSTVSAGGVAMLSTPNGAVVETGKAMSTDDLLVVATRGPDALDRIETLVYSCGDELESTCSEKVTGYTYVNSSWMALYGERGATALVSNGLKCIHGPVTGVVTLDASGTPTLAGTGYKTLAEPAAKRACEAQKCPYSSCVVGVVDEIARSVSCAGLKIWEWPTGISLRMLVEPEVIDAPEGRVLGEFDGCVSQMDSCLNRNYYGVPNAPDSAITACQNARSACIAKANAKAKATVRASR
jgi:hypothetical protein